MREDTATAFWRLIDAVPVPDEHAHHPGGCWRWHAACLARAVGAVVLSTGPTVVVDDLLAAAAAFDGRPG